jgi:hypothetical protein
VRRNAVIGLTALAFLACTPASSGGGGGASSSAAPVTIAAVPTEGGGAPKSAPTAPSAVSTWTGKYTSEPGSLYVVDGGAWAEVKWRGDDAGLGLGDGSMTLTVNSTTHDVHGTADGAIGSVVIVGSISENSVTASVLRKDPADQGLTGTVVAKVTGEALTGTMRLSVANARVIREVKFSLSPAKP